MGRLALRAVAPRSAAQPAPCAAPWAIRSARWTRAESSQREDCHPRTARQRPGVRWPSLSITHKSRRPLQGQRPVLIPAWANGPGCWPNRSQGLKARDVIAWGEARSAQPQVNVRKESPQPCKGVPSRPVRVTALQALECLRVTLTWASARRRAPAQAVTSRAFQPSSAGGHAGLGRWPSLVGCAPLVLLN